MRNAPKQFYDFGSFRVDPQKHRLLRGGEAVVLPTKCFGTLLLLVQNPGKLLSREELLNAVWTDAFVEDANLTVAISTLRKALGQEAQSYIETVPRLGYRFLGDVEIATEETKPVIVEKHRISRTIIEEEVSEVPTTRRFKSVAGLRVSQVVTLVTIVAVAIGAFVYSKRADRHTALASSNSFLPIRSIVVLPPKSLISADADNSSLSLGVADALITRLGGVRDLSVRPTSVSMRYINSSQDPLDVGRALAVDAVLEGSLQRENGRVRLTLRMINVSTGKQMWSANFDESDKDIFRLQDSLSQEVAKKLFGELSKPEKEQLTRQQTHSAQAYAAYVKGMYIWGRRGNQVVESLPYFRQAIELDPNFAEAYVGLATVDATSEIPSPEAETLIARALQLNDSLAEAHATNALIKMFHHWDWQTTEQELDKAIELDPNSVSAHHWKGVYLSLRGRLDEAKAEMHYALKLDPTSPIIMADIGQLHYFSHEYDQAVEYCNRALSLDPQSQMPQIYLFDIYLAKGMDDEALKHLAIFDIGTPKSDFTNKTIAEFQKSGLSAVMKGQLEGYSRLSQDAQLNLALKIAQYNMVLKNPDESLRWLERTPARPNFFLPYIAVDPLYDPVRSNPRFQAVLGKINLN